NLLSMEQLVDECLVLLLREREVEIVGSFPFAISRLCKRDRGVDRVAGHDGGDGVVECELRVADGLRERSCQGFCGKRTGRRDARLRPGGPLGTCARYGAEA